ncbi:MAG TPA: hypothetical protein DCZ94_07825 [Lentisphaeria bacterium]|nr:MAG: hypothetical protein A2X48_24225 [Lentisphaerae bacterium GWF2_49_21]HBC86845.1 hypothetical protein [Lentisphaeria bacterium]
MKKNTEKTNYLRSIAKFARLRFSIEERKAAEIYPFLASNYYLGLIGKDLKNDPVYRQCFPDARELLRKKELLEDPLAEEKQMPTPCLIHRYTDRVVLLVTNRCAVHCRFCLRKRNWKDGNDLKDISDKYLHEACKYIKGHDKIREVLISGGDPLMLETASLKKIIDSIVKIKNIDVIRIGTRMPVVLPSRIDSKLVRMLSKYQGLWVMSHFNHPVELTPESEEACRKLVKAGIPMLNQTVLLKGINDNAKILEELFRGLVKIRVKPHYLFHVDPAEGNIHFRTGIAPALEILRKLRPRLSSLCTPVFAIDLPEGGGKVPLLPDYCRGGRFLGINGREIPYFI